MRILLRKVQIVYFDLLFFFVLLMRAQFYNTNKHSLLATRHSFIQNIIQVIGVFPFEPALKRVPTKLHVLKLCQKLNEYYNIYVGSIFLKKTIIKYRVQKSTNYLQSVHRENMTISNIRQTRNRLFYPLFIVLYPTRFVPNMVKILQLDGVTVLPQ